MRKEKMPDTKPEPIIEAEVVPEGDPSLGVDVHGVVDTHVGTALQIYQNVAMQPLAPAEVAAVAKYQIADEQNGLAEKYDMLPTGELYLPQVHYRRILNEVFGFGGWAMVPLDPDPRVTGNQLVQQWALIGSGGRFISQAVGGAEYQADNPRQLWSDAWETVKSNALMRLCKDLGIAGDCWDRKYVQKWREAHCVAVWVKKWSKPGGVWTCQGVEKQYRMAEAEPSKHELRLVRDGEKDPPKVDNKGNEIGGGQQRQPEQQKSAPAKAEEKPPAKGKPAPKSDPAPAEDPVAPKPHSSDGPLLRHGKTLAAGEMFTAHTKIANVTRKKRKRGGVLQYKKDTVPPNSVPLYDYTVETVDGDKFGTFSESYAKRLFEDGQKKGLQMDLKLKTTHVQNEEQGKPPHVYLNLVEILGAEDDELGF